MKSYSHIVTSNYVSVMDLQTGEVTKVLKDSPRFDDAVDAVRRGDCESVTKMNVKSVLAAHTNDTGDALVTVEDGIVWYNTTTGKQVLHNAMTDRIMKMINEGFDSKPLVAFMNNLMLNPSKASVDELYLFLEATELPITTDGHFIAYKMVNDDYTSIHDGKFMNTPGTVVEMPRNLVDDNRHNTCSYGLHFCSKNYLPSYGRADGTRLLLVKINPADVVSIPSDYNNAKGRASKYLIWKDITEPGWREKYLHQDYNRTSVEVIDGAPDEVKDADSDTFVSLAVCSAIDNMVDYTPSMSDTLESTGLDDLDIIELIMTVEDQLGLEIDSDLESLVASSMTVADLCQLFVNVQKGPVNVPSTIEKDSCPDCGHTEYYKKGTVTHAGVTKSRRKCKACAKNYYVEVN